MRTRRDVWNLAKDPNDKTLYWYSVAVQEMQSRMFDNPNSWKFQAAVHGYDQQVYPPLRPGEHLPTQAVQTQFWDNCQHASWWFLPWHRIYVFLLEKMCRDIIASKNGPADWALPYWDYSHPSGAVQRTLPQPFRAQNVNGAANPLFAVRNAGVNAGGQVGSTQQSQDTSCMKSKIFSGTTPNGFGGGPAPVVQFSQYTGSCENGPHNSMHDAIGGPTGWMDNPDAAALDPIFWLHHSNIDRLWVIWAKAHGALKDPKWLNQTFEFYNEKGVAKTYKVSDVLQTTGPLCDYVYESTAAPAAVQPAAPAAQPAAAPPPAGSGALQELAAKVMSKSQIIGASEAPGVTLGEGVTSVGVTLHAPAPLAAIAHEAVGATAEQAQTAPSIHLNLENVTAKQNPIHAYEVYVNVPSGDSPSDHPELLAGLISRFGLVKSSQSGEHHGGQGLNLSFDITDIAAALEKAGTWDAKNVHVTFVPHDVDEAKALAAEGRAVPKRNPVHVGRVSVSAL